LENYTHNTPNIWFPDQQEPVYDPQDFVSIYQFKEYWKREKDRCINGFYLADGQVHIPGRLYFHTVYWKIAAYIEKERTDEQGKKKTVKVREIITPLLLDTVWDIFQDLEEAERQGRFYDLFGSRDFGKSITAASVAGHQYTFFDNSESVISGGAYDYIKLATDKIEDGLTNLHPVWQKQRLANDWKKEVKAGWKDKTTGQVHPKSSMSRILMRNYENGVKSMAANGTRPGFHLIDEIGTIQHLIASIKDSDGCWWSGGGNKPSCLVMICGTGGDMEVGAEAAAVSLNPEAYNFLSFDNPETGGKMGRFISALRAKLKYKESKTLADYLGIDHPDLHKITILVSDEERAMKEWWEPEYAKALKSGNQKTITKFKAYWPIVPSDSFLVIAANNYPVEACKRQKARLIAEEYTGEFVELFHDGEKIRHKKSSKLPITQFPVKDQNTDAPIVIYEHPVPGAPWGLYLGGVDPYRHDEGDSLGVVYIYKRMHDISGEKFQDMIVASYASRPKSQDEWNEQARFLIRYYNAFTLVENDEYSFVRYMQNKGDDYLLCDQPDWLKDIVPNSTVNRGKGIHRSSDKMRNFLRGCQKRYLEDPIYQERDEQGTIIREILGVSRVLDTMLLEELIKYNKEGNYDREVAASLVFALADKMEPLGKVATSKGDPRYKSLFERPAAQPLFSQHKSTLFKNNRRLFKR
jgi:hypothetical protein